MKLSVALSVLLLLLSACGKKEEAAPPAPPTPPQAAREPAPAPAPVPETPVAAEPAPSSLVEPAKLAPDTYVVVRGDTLYGIAKKHGLNHRELAQWNDISNAHRLRVGKELRLRPPGS